MTAKNLERVQFRSGWYREHNDTFAVTLHFHNIATEEDRDLILHKVSTMMQRLLVESEEVAVGNGT